MSGRWIIDAMNVIGSRPDGWWKDRKSAMRNFARQVDEHAKSTARDITVVFDTDPGELPESSRIEVAVAQSRGRNAADKEIERLVTEADDVANLRVVTSDGELADSVRAAGATIVSSGAFRAELEG